MGEGDFDINIYWSDLDKKDQKELNRIFDMSLDFIKSVSEMLIEDHMGLLDVNDILPKYKENVLPPAIKKNLIMNILFFHKFNTKYINLQDAIERNAFNPNKDTILVWDKGRWYLNNEKKAVLKLGEKYLKKYGVYEIVLPATLPDDIEENGPFKLASFHHELLDKDYLKLYYRSESRELSEVDITKITDYSIY